MAAAVLAVLTGALGWAFAKTLRSHETKWMGFADLSLLTYYRVNAMTLDTTLSVHSNVLFYLLLGVLVALASHLAAAVVGGRL